MAEEPILAVLVADDEEMVREIVQLCLAQHRFKVETAPDGLTAIRKLREKHYDVVLTDLMMPGADGHRVLDAAKEKDQDTVVIIMTGHGTLPSAVNAMKRGAADYLTKPFADIQAIPIAIRRAVERTQMNKEILALREVAQLKDAFLNLVSAELLSPLTQILSSVELLLDEKAAQLDAEAKEMLSILRQSGDRLQRLLEEMLLLRDLALEAAEPRMERLDARPVLAEVVASVMGAAAARRVEVEVQSLDGAPLLFADKDLLFRALRALVENAVKFTAPGTAASVTWAREGDGVAISVRDRGPGVPAALKEKVFEKFFQGEELLTREHQGAGLGLALVKAIAKALEGEVRLEAAPGGGSVFTLVVQAAP